MCAFVISITSCIKWNSADFRLKEKKRYWSWVKKKLLTQFFFTVMFKTFLPGGRIG